VKCSEGGRETKTSCVIEISRGDRKPLGGREGRTYSNPLMEHDTKGGLGFVQTATAKNDETSLRKGNASWEGLNPTRMRLRPAIKPSKDTYFIDKRISHRQKGGGPKKKSETRSYARAVDGAWGSNWTEGEESGS